MSTKANTTTLNLLCILPIVIITIIFYWDGMETYFYEPFLCDLVYNEDYRHSLYLTGRPHVRVVFYALGDTLYHLFHLNPLPYHIVTISIHIINSILVLFITKKLADNRLIGFITAVLFATFWAHCEPVPLMSWHEMLLASFILSTLVFFYAYRQNPTRLNYSLVLFFAVLAIGTKESAPIILVPLIYLTDKYIALESPEVSRARLGKSPYIPLLLLSLGVLAYLGFGPVYDSCVKGVAHYDKVFSNFARWVSFTFSFPLLSDEPRWGNVNLILLALFYFSSPMQIRDRISLLMAADALLAIPTAPLGSPALRYLYLSSFFSMTIFGLMLYNGIAKMAGIIYIKESFSKALVVILCSVLVYSNYFYVNKVIKYFNRAGSVSKKLLKMVSSSFPSGTLNIHLIFINFPPELRDEHGSYPVYELAGQTLLPAYYGRSKVGKVSYYNILEVHDGKYRLTDCKNISPLEFENLTQEKGNRVYFFSSKDDSIHDVTGKDYTYLRKLFNEHR